MELTIEIKTKPGKFQELYQTLLGLLPTIRKGKGCKECRVYRDVEDGEVFFLRVTGKHGETWNIIYGPRMAWPSSAQSTC